MLHSFLHDALPIFCNVSGEIAIQQVAIVTEVGSVTIYGVSALEADVFAGSADKNLIFAALDLPFVRLGIVYAECALIERYGDFNALACLDKHLFKTF